MAGDGTEHCWERAVAPHTLPALQLGAGAHRPSPWNTEALLAGGSEISLLTYLTQH